MARKPTNSQVPDYTLTEADAPGLPVMVAEVNQVAAADAVILDAFETIKAIGRMEMAEFSATVSEKVLIETFLWIKETKRYKGLPFRSKEGKSETVSDLEQFCQVFLKKSYRRCQQLAGNYNLLGADLYEQAETMGLRQQDYAAIKALPADDQEIIKQALAEESKDKVLEVLQDMAVKHAAERAELNKQTEETRNERDAARRVAEDKQLQINRLRTDIDALRDRAATIEPDERLVELQTICMSDMRQAGVGVWSMAANMRQLIKHAAQHNLPDQHGVMSGWVAQLATELAKVRDEFGLPDATAAVPEWLQNPAWQLASAKLDAVVED